jgi:hypothetical protein
MRIAVIAVGRLKQGPERELAERYFERFDEAGRKLGFRELAIHELPESRARDTATRRRSPRMFPKNRSWWRWTSAARIWIRPYSHGISGAGATRVPVILSS